MYIFKHISHVIKVEMKQNFFFIPSWHRFIKWVPASIKLCVVSRRQFDNLYREPSKQPMP